MKAEPPDLDDANKDPADEDEEPDEIAAAAANDDREGEPESKALSTQEAEFENFR